jgi:hypothetical protein
MNTQTTIAYDLLFLMNSSISQSSAIRKNCLDTFNS